MEALLFNKSFRNLSELKHYGFGSLLSMMDSPLAEGARLLAHELDSPTTISCFKDAPLVTAQGGSAGFKPSLAFFVDVHPRINLVVSCVRLAGVWSSKSLEAQTDNSMWPIIQLSNYAKFSGTRYSFIMTEIEVVVVRFYKTTSGEFGAQWQAISRSACGEGTMTVGLAIWCLVMMSLNSDHRVVADQAETLPINAWWREGNATSGIVYHHHLSGRQLPFLPTGAVELNSQT